MHSTNKHMEIIPRNLNFSFKVHHKDTQRSFNSTELPLVATIDFFIHTFFFSNPNWDRLELGLGVGVKAVLMIEFGRGGLGHCRIEYIYFLFCIHIISTYF